MKLDDLTEKEYKIMLDLDGVAADFCKGVKKLYPEFVEGNSSKKQDREMWKRISKYQREGNEFWYELEPMPGFNDLISYVSKYSFEILSACGEPRFNAAEQKIKWVRKHIDNNVKINLVRRSVDKAAFAKPTYILVDDKNKALDPFIAAGGLGVLFKNSGQAIQDLKKIIE